MVVCGAVVEVFLGGTDGIQNWRKCGLSAMCTYVLMSECVLVPFIFGGLLGKGKMSMYKYRRDFRYCPNT